MISKTLSIFGWNFQQFLQNWSQTQNLTLHEQLSAGVRYLDFRIGISGRERTWSFHHGIVYGDNLEEHLKTVNRFLRENPSEIVVIGVSHLENFSSRDLRKLVGILDAVFGELLLQAFEGWMDVPIRTLQRANKRLIFMFLNLEVDWLAAEKRVWVNEDNRYLFNTWANKNEIAEMVEFNETQVKKFKSLGPVSPSKAYSKYDVSSGFHRKLHASSESNEKKGIFEEDGIAPGKQAEMTKREALGEQMGDDYNDGFYLMSWTLTPSVKLILSSLFPTKTNSLYELSNDTFYAFLSFIEKKKKNVEYPIMGNILIFDFIDKNRTPDIIKHLLDLN